MLFSLCRTSGSKQHTSSRTTIVHNTGFQVREFRKGCVAPPLFQRGPDPKEILSKDGRVGVHERFNLVYGHGGVDTLHVRPQVLR